MRNCRVLVIGALVLATGSAACGITEDVGQTKANPPGDGLDCVDDTRMTMLGEPVEGFAGYPTPEEAVLSIASAVPVDGTPVLRGDIWFIEATDGRAVASTRVEPWRNGWFAGEITSCSDADHGA